MRKLILVLFVLSTVNVSFSQPWMNYLPEEKSNTVGTNFYDIQNAFNQYCLDNNIEGGYVIKNGEKIKSRGWKQFKRWEDFMEPRVYPSGVFPKTMLWQELQKKNSVQEKSTTGNWVHLGPSAVPTDINSGGNRGVGRINAIAFHPTNSNILWAGAPSGGFWKSTDGGSTWATTTDDLDAIGVSDIAVNPDNTDEIYIVTGDGDAYDAYAIGILKSTDGGANWTSVLDLSYSSKYVFRRILINPNDPSIMIASSNGGILRTTNSWSSYSTVQSGVFKDLEFKPGDPNTVYATSYSSSGDAKVYKSTDGGANWSTTTTGMSISGLVNRIELAVTAANSSVVYALCSSASDYGFYGLYKSSDSGTNWTQVTSNSSINLLGWDTDGQDSGGQGWYDLSLAVSPTNENEVYTGGVNIWKSTNGGSSWTINSHWYGGGGAEYVHADIHTLAYSPSNVLYSGNDGGLYKTSDGGTNWNDISAGLQILQIYKLGADALNADVVIIGAQDNGTMKRNGSTWNAIIGGDGMECLVDYTNSNIMYGEYYYGNLNKSTDGGYNFSSIKPSGSPDGAWVTPFVIHPTDHNTLIAGFDDVYQTTNGGSSWTTISSNLTNGDLLKTLTYAPSNPSYIYAATSYGIWKTTNGGSSWASITSGLPNNSITDVEVSQNDPETIWVTFSGFDASYKVYKSTNGGSSYTNFSTGLPNVPVNCILYENNSNEALYLGCDLGVYYRDGSMSTWTTFDQGLPNVIVRELEIQYSTSKIRAATYGRGLWESDLYSDVAAAPVANFQATSTSISSNESVNFTDLSSNTPTSWSWTFEGGTPSTSTDQNPVGIVYSADGVYDVTLTVTNANGSDTEVKYDFITVSTSTSTTLLEESFESGTATGWSVVNNDGDANQWSIFSETDNPDYDLAHTGDKGIGVLYNINGNDDWLITPQLTLPSGSNISFSFWARSHSSSYLEDFNVKLSTSDASITSFTTSLETVTGASSNWTEYTYDLSAYAGQNIYLAVQCVSVNEWYLFADDFLVTASQVASVVAAFSGTPLSGTAPLDVTFTDESTGSPTSWSWSFGDGITSTEQNPVHNYSTAGTYTVSLTVSDGTNSDTETKVDYIQANGGIETPAYLTADLNSETGAVQLNWQENSSAVFDDFTGTTAANWVPVTGSWTVADGLYKVSSNNYEYSTSYYNANFAKFNTEVKIRKNTGTSNHVGVCYGDPSQITEDGIWSSSIKIAIGTADDWQRWSVYKYVDGTDVAIQSWVVSSDINAGPSAWNVIKIVFDAGYYDFYFNGILQGSYYDNTILNGKIGLLMYDTDTAGQADIDYVSISDMSKSYTFGKINQDKLRKVYTDPVYANGITASEPEFTFENAPTAKYGNYYTSYSNKAFLNYNIYRDGSIIGNTTITSYTDNLTTYGSYDYYVTAVYDEGESDASNTVNVNWESTQTTTTLTGHVTDALTGNSVEGALVAVAGLSDYTDVNGNYTIENVPFGSLKAEFIADNVSGFAPLNVQFTDQSLVSSQTVTASATGYNTYINELVEINSSNTVNLDISLSPELATGQMRIVLNWSSSPNDLDSHLKTPEIEGNTYHVYYSNQGSADSPPYATLDHDVTSGYGPETMTIYNFSSGTYHYYIYNYSGSPDITTSQAVVQLYNDNGLANTINVPTIGTGRYWHVFDIDGYSQSVTVINQILESEPGEVKSNEKYALKKVVLKSKDITTWSWNFGDGSTSTDQNPSHTYSSAGQFTVSLQISDGSSTNLETKTDYINVIGQANATLSGLVKNAVDGSPIEGALVTVAGLSDYTDANGNYLIENVPAGVLNADFIANPRNGNNPLSVSFYDQSADAAQTVTATAEGYSNYVNNQVAINADQVVNLDISLSPLLASGQMRIVLNWGESPSDLDSHLKTPEIEGSTYHVYYSNQGSEESAPYATLDYDVTSGYGPETITLYSLFEGVYYYYIYQYSDAGLITESSAVVQIYNNEGTAQTINVPTYGTGRYWNVCTINGNTGAVNIINQIQETEPGTVDKGEVKIKKSTSKSIVNWSWNFGDGFTSTEQNPVHTYSNTGAYTVALTISNETTSITETKIDYIQIWPVFVDEQNADRLISIYPNPGNGIFNFELQNMDEDVNLVIYNIKGTQVYANHFNGNSSLKVYSIDLSTQTPGLYFVKVQTGKNVYLDKLMIK